MAKSNLTYQTDKFIIKCSEKNGKYYVVLLNKSTKETIIKYFRKQSTAETHFGKVMGWNNKKVNEYKISNNDKEPSLANQLL